jgi:hypothetical protein
MTSTAWATELPVARAKWWAAERSPLAFQPPPSATRAAASDFSVAAIPSIEAASSTACWASPADSTAASKPAAYRRMPSRSSTSDSHIALVLSTRPRKRGRANVCS